MISYMTASSRNNFCTTLVVPFFVDPKSKDILLPKDFAWIKKTQPYVTDFYPHHTQMKIGGIYTTPCILPGTAYKRLMFVRLGNDDIDALVHNCLLQLMDLTNERAYLPIFFLGSKLPESEVTQREIEGAIQFQQKNINNAQILLALMNQHPKAVEILNEYEIPNLGTWNPKDKKFDL